MGKKTPKVIGIIQLNDEGHRVTEWHANGALASANYDTICGLDGNDSNIDTFGLVAARSGQKITCPNCWSAWSSWRQFRRDDFAQAE